MTLAKRLRASTALLAAAGLLHAPVAFAQSAPRPAPAEAAMTVMPESSSFVKQYASVPSLAPKLTYAQKQALLKQHIKYVFVLFQENRSFDHYFGTFPGARGLFSGGKLNTGLPGAVQPIVNTDGSVGTISPFLIPQTVTAANGKAVPLYPADLGDVDHGHTGIAVGIDVDPATNRSRNDRFAIDNEGLTTDASGALVSKATNMAATTKPTLAQKQTAELVMAHVDCDTVPFLWQYADRFALFDNFHMTVDGPSTPNAIAMIAGQGGETQYVKHPDQVAYEPVLGDPGPFPGSNLDKSAVKPPFNPADENPNKPTLPQTYASLPLSFMGPQIQQIIKSDENPAMDLLDVQNDILQIAKHNKTNVPWGWYQEGYDHEPFDTGANNAASTASYIVHHNGPQYFGYVGDNPQELLHLHGLGDFYTDIANRALPAGGGVFYVRGGYNNLDGLVPQDPNPTVQAAFKGNNDHPAYSDSQISEAALADAVNAIAMSPYWKDSAIIITYDESDGYYDHASFEIRSYSPDGLPYAAGSRIPAIVISPYGLAHVAEHSYAEHSSIIRFINNLFGLTPLAELPDEASARAAGLAAYGQPRLGPADSDQVWQMSDMSNAFDNARLTGAQPPLPPAYAMIPPAQVHSLPHYGGQGCRTLHITPTDYRNGTPVDPAPADFNPRPTQTPGTPTSGTWTP
ncbi:phospholipase C [Lichenibacterium dinghuense]|uniref:phospholipase C n=1 Tax=Lichenibacterium dinghuense TaxID=2895977 RepID=UPI001F1E7189|nr:alkaline phosphatase family protein [Lichenibacterium sp. 6Y81]